MSNRLMGTLGLLLAVTPVTAQQKPAATPVEFHGTYEELKPAQQQLIDEWYAEYNRMTNDHSDPKEYNEFSLSTRTTFEAVTHALMTTNLSDKSGKPMGTALDLVQAIEAINGKVPRARGDLQFRMYVLLKPDALQKLKDSSEFFRDRDNTVYHHGYPLSYRQEGTPSIQFSIAKDSRHADIDVDYRSSGFPAGLFNGHLTAANSDVRAGNNTQTHLQRWQGLTSWWQNLFGLTDAAETADVSVAEGEVPPIPRKGDGKLEDAVQDFLQAWLVEQRPEISAAYLSPRSFACLKEYGPQAGKEINAGVAPYLAARDMAATSRAIGKAANLQQAAKPSSLEQANLKLIKQPPTATFSLYQASNGAAADFECDPTQAYDDFDRSRVAGTAGKFGRYFVSVFRLNAPGGRSDPISLLWTREGKYWKVVAWDLEPEEAKPRAMPDTRRGQATAAATARHAHSKGDPDFLHALHDFLHSWLVADNFDQAATYFSPRCNACVDTNLAGESKPSTPAEYSAYIRNAITTVGKDIGTVHHLHDALKPVMPDHEGLKVVEHAGEDAYTVVAIPDYLADTFLCEKKSAGHPYDPPTETTRPKSYRNYYATLFVLRTPGDHPAALTLLWSKDSGQWKIIAYEMVTP